MTHLHRLFAAVILVIAPTIPAFAGDMQAPGFVRSAPQSAASTALDPWTEIVLNFLQDVLLMF